MRPGCSRLWRHTAIHTWNHCRRVHPIKLIHPENDWTIRQNRCTMKSEQGTEDRRRPKKKNIDPDRQTYTDRHTDRDRQTDRQTDTETEQTDRQRQTDRQTAAELSNGSSHCTLLEVQVRQAQTAFIGVTSYLSGYTRPVQYVVRCYNHSPWPALSMEVPFRDGDPTMC